MELKTKIEIAFVWSSKDNKMNLITLDNLLGIS